MDVAPYIDHTILKPTTSIEDIKKLCSEARQYKFAGSLRSPPFVKNAKGLLQNTSVKVATVIGFPFGYSVANAKLVETEKAIEDGADEMDVVINLSAVKSGSWSYLESEMKLITDYVHKNNRIIKVIIESGVLSDEEIIHRRCGIRCGGCRPRRRGRASASDPAVEAGAARIGVDEAVLPISTVCADQSGRSQAVMPTSAAPSHDGIGHTPSAADQRVEALVEMVGVKARRIDRPDVGVGGAGGTQRLAMRFRQLDEAANRRRRGQHKGDRASLDARGRRAGCRARRRRRAGSWSSRRRSIRRARARARPRRPNRSSPRRYAEAHRQVGIGRREGGFRIEPAGADDRVGVLHDRLRRGWSRPRGGRRSS